MPWFYGRDYYLLAITDHAAGLNKAILAIPQSLRKHMKDCCVNVTDILESFSNDLKAFPDISTTDLKNGNSDIVFIQSLQDDTVEPYDIDVITGRDGKGQLVEVIPSSNPESSSSLFGSLDQEHSVVNHAEPTCLEEFAILDLYTEHLQPFDEPVNVNHFRLAIESLPSSSVLLSRLKSIDLEDPLLKLDGSSWNNEDFQCIHDNCDEWRCDTPQLVKVHEFHEIFSPAIVDVGNNTSAEALLPYRVPKPELETTNMCTSDCIPTLNYPEHGFPEEQDFLTEDFELVISQLLSGLSDKNTVFNLHDDVIKYDCDKSTTSQASDVETFVKCANFSTQEVQTNCGPQECLSPFIEYRIIDIVNDDDDDVLSVSLLQAPLEKLTPEEGFLSDCSLLDEDMNNIEKYIWEEEKRFDEVQFSEPLLKQENLLNPITEAFVCLGLQPEDTQAENELLQWSFGEPEKDSSLSEITVLPDDLHREELNDCEIFDKFQVSELDVDTSSDYMLASTFERNMCLMMNDITQDATMKCDNASNAARVNDENNDFQPLDPLDSFIYVRARSGRHVNKDVPSSPNSCDKQKHTDGNQAASGMLADTSSPSNEQQGDVKTVEVVFCGPWEKVLQCIIDGATSHLESIKQESLVPHKQGFMDISMDMTRYLLKEGQKHSSDIISEGDSHSFYTQKENILQSLSVVNILRTAADLLIHGCLESCITYLAANTEDGNAPIARSCSEVHKQLFTFQCQFLQDHRTHPKLSILMNEVGKCAVDSPSSKILIVAETSIKGLVCAICNVLCQVPEVMVTVIEDWKCLEVREPKTMVFIGNVLEVRGEILSQFNHVILYDERHNTHIRTSCLSQAISYIGFITHYFCQTHPIDKPGVLKRIPQATLICSVEVTQRTQLVYLLETGYNIMVIEREYHKLCAAGTKMHFADVIVSTTYCVVLMSLRDMKKHWDLTAAVTRFVALGLQFSHCCVILHCMDVGNGYVLERETLGNIYKLTAALCNLRRTSSAFDASYKMLISLTVEDVASCIRTTVDHCMACDMESDFIRPWLSADVSQSEATLLQLSCINSLSAQILLCKLSICEILQKSDRELATCFPEIPEKIFKYLHYTLSLKYQQSGLPSSSQNTVVTGVSSPSSHTMRMQSNSPLSQTTDVDVDVKIDDTSEVDIISNVSLPKVQTAKFVHTSRTHEPKYPSLVHTELITRNTNLDILTRDQSYNCVPDGHRCRSVPCYNLTEPAACEVYSQGTCHSSQQINDAHFCQENNRSHLAQTNSSTGHNNSYNLVQSREYKTHHQVSSLYKKKATIDYDHCKSQEVQTESDSPSLNPSTNFCFTRTGSSENIIQGFHRKIAKAMQTFDFHGFNECPSSNSSTLMWQTCESQPHRNDKRFESETATTCSRGYTYEEFGTDDEPDFSFQVSDTRDKEQSLLGLSLFNQVKKEVEDNMYEDRRFNLTENSTVLNSGSHKSSYSLTSDSKLCNCEPSDGYPAADINHHRSDVDRYFSCRLSDDLFAASHHIPISHQDSQTKTNSFGLFSTKAQRLGGHGDILMLGDNHDQQCNNILTAATVFSKSLGRFPHNTLALPYNKSYDGLLSSVGVRDSVVSVDSLPFSVSKQLKNHIRKHSAQESHDQKLFPQANTNSVRVSQQPDYGNNWTNISNCDCLALSDHRQLKYPVTQQEFQDSTRDHRQLKYPVTQQEFQESTRDHRQLKYPVTQQEFQDSTKDHRQLKYPVTQEEFQDSTRDHRQLRNPEFQDSPRDHRQLKYPVAQQEFQDSTRDHRQLKYPVTQQEFQDFTRDHIQLKYPVTQQEFQDSTKDHRQLRNPEFQDSTRDHKQLRNPVTQEYQDLYRELHTSVLAHPGHKGNSTIQELEKYTNKSDISLCPNMSQTWNKYPQTLDCVQQNSRDHSSKTEQTRFIPLHGTEFTNAPDRNVHVNNVQHLTSRFTDSYRTDSLPDTTTGAMLFNMFQRCLPSRNNGTERVQHTMPASMPYTPRHRITVGLAQPFPRQTGLAGHPPDMGPIGENSDSYTIHRADESPPMDLLPDGGDNSSNDKKMADSNRHMNEVKRRKWNHLLSCTSKQEDQNRSVTSNIDTGSAVDSSGVTCLPSNRKRKLQLEKQPGNNGQTVLVFK